MKKLYIAAMSAQNTRDHQIYMAPALILLESLEKAREVAKKSCRNLYPPEDGYTNHLIAVDLADDGLLREYVRQLQE